MSILWNISDKIKVSSQNANESNSPNDDWDDGNDNWEPENESDVAPEAKDPSLLENEEIEAKRRKEQEEEEKRIALNTELETFLENIQPLTAFDVNKIEELLSTNDEQKQLEAISTIIKFAQNDIKTCRLCSDLSRNVLKRLTDLLYEYDLKLQIASAKALEVIASEVPIMHELHSLGAIDRIEYLRRTNNPVVKAQMESSIDTIRNQVRLIGIGRKKKTTSDNNNNNNNSKDEETQDLLEYLPQSQYELVIPVKQERFANCGVGHKLWPAAQILSRWIYDNKLLFEGKTVVEVGSGPGLASLVASKFSKSVIATDYLPDILEMLKANIRLNEANNMSTLSIDWEQIYNDQEDTIELPTCDFLIASDVVYTRDTAEWLARTVAKMLKKGGIFFCVIQNNRVGLYEFMELLAVEGLRVDQKPVEDRHIEEGTLNMWTFITAQFVPL